jgi:hypothetical protein
MRSRTTVPSELAGKWVAWDRDQTQIISAADSFDEVKRLAADFGWREVVIAKVLSKSKWRSNGCHLLCVVTVFIAGMSNSLSDFVGW